MTRVLEVVDELDKVIIALLEDEDHLVRTEAAVSLAMSASQTSLRTLQDACGDRSETVREAARYSLDQRMQSASPVVDLTNWRE